MVQPPNTEELGSRNSPPKRNTWFFELISKLATGSESVKIFYPDFIDKRMASSNVVLPVPITIELLSGISSRAFCATSFL